jgi:hypothetical protein
MACRPILDNVLAIMLHPSLCHVLAQMGSLEAKRSSPNQNTVFPYIKYGFHLIHSLETSLVFILKAPVCILIHGYGEREKVYQLMSLYPQPINHQPAVESLPLPRLMGPAHKS